MQQLPKLPGFRSLRTKAENVFTDDLANLNVSKINTETLYESKLISSPYIKVKLLYRGEIKKKLDVSLPAASAKAIEAIQAAGGNFNKCERLARPQTRKKEAKD